MEDTNSLARPGDEGVPQLTAQEEAFLRAYSESLNRMEALGKAGLLPSVAPDMAEQQRLLHLANRIILKAERMSLAAIASAMGKDRLYLLHHLGRICEDAQGHQAIKGLQLLARIHGLWDKSSAGSRQVALIFGAPPEPQQPKRVSNLPFVIEADYTDEAENTAH